MNRKMTRAVAATLLIAGVSTTLMTRAAAPAGRLTISNGTVYDNKTKLTWQQQTASGGKYAVAAGQSYCSSLTLDGLAWRLPTYKELNTIIDYSVTSPAIDATAFPNTPADYFATATPETGTTQGYLINFTDGKSAQGVTTTAFGYVRCVH